MRSHHIKGIKFESIENASFKSNSDTASQWAGKDELLPSLQRPPAVLTLGQLFNDVYYWPIEVREECKFFRHSFQSRHRRVRIFWVRNVDAPIVIEPIASHYGRYVGSWLYESDPGHVEADYL